MTKNDFMNTEKEYLHKFINDFADGGAINHLADLGLSVSQIMEKLDFPLPKAVVAQKVWEHYVSIGKILYEEPAKDREYIEQITYEKVQGKYGRSSMQQIRTKIPISDRDYVECNYGKLIKRDYEGFLKSLALLNDEDRDYILSLPWPRATVYHEIDDRMERILLMSNK